MFTEELTGLSRRKKPRSNPHTTCFEYTQLNLSQNYRWVFRGTLKACPSTLASLLIGLGKEHQDTVKSESLLENQIHRLEKFSRATPSWLVGKPQRDLPEPPRRAKLRAGCDTLTAITQATCLPNTQCGLQPLNKWTGLFAQKRWE